MNPATAAVDPAQWSNLFVMAGGAGAALAGLLFVAVALNHEQILSSGSLPPLTARALATLFALVIQCALGLTPGQPVQALGVETTVLGVVLGVGVAVATVRELRHLGHHGWRAGRIVLSVASTVPTLTAGASLTLGVGGGLYWVLVGVVAAFAASGYSGWVLLIEIRR